jgi:hypothetical protein
MAKWGEKARHFESYWSLGNLIWTTVLSLGSLMAGWLTAAQAWAEGTLQPYGTLGYVATILAVALLLALLFYVAAAARSRWIAPHGQKPPEEQPTAETRVAAETKEAPPQFRTLPDPNFRISYGDEGTYRGAHETLMLFVVEHLLPTCNSQITMQEKLIQLVCGANEVNLIAHRGLLTSGKLNDFAEGYNALRVLEDSPPEFIPFETMIKSVNQVEQGYSKLNDQGRKIVSALTPEKIDSDALKCREDWRVRHNALIEAYERIRKDSRMGILFRPARASRWGPPLDPIDLSGVN